MSRLNSTLKEVNEAYEGYHPTRAARAIERFVEELSNWYIRRSRRRFWSTKEAGSNGTDEYDLRQASCLSNCS